MSNRECMICFDEKEVTITCKCNSSLCDECFSEYTQSCINDKGKLPKCVVCPREYLFECFEDFEPALEYANVLLEFIRKNPDFQNKVNTVTKEKKLIEKLRAKKAEIFERIPKALKYIIETTMMTEYKEAMKVNMQHVKTQIQKKKCFSGVCPTGNLDNDEHENWICDTCSNTFCRRCEHIMFDNHTCKQEDLESLQFISSLVHCPTCQAPVQKIDGCNNLTCSMCGTSFNEISGEKSEYGGHNSKLELKDVKYSLSLELGDKYEKEIIDFVKEYESEEPEQPDYDIFVPYLEQEELNDEEKLELFELYSNFKTKQYEIKTYYSNILAIRQLHIDEQLTSDNLIKLFS